MCKNRGTIPLFKPDASSSAPASKSPSDNAPRGGSLSLLRPEIVVAAVFFLVFVFDVWISRGAIPPEATSYAVTPDAASLLQQITHQQEQGQEMLQRAQMENQPMLFHADGSPVINAEELRAPAWTAAAGAAGVGAEPDEPEAAAAAAAPDPNLEDDNDQAAAGTETAGPPDVVLPPPDVVLSANDKQKAHLREKRLKFKLGTDVVPKEGYSQKEYLHEKRMKWKAEQKRLAKLEKAKIKKAAGGA